MGEKVMNAQKENKMGTMPVGRLLLTMSLPMMVSMLIQALYNIVDSMFVAQINEQLAYREANKGAVASFNTSRILGEHYKVYIDDAAGKFMVVEDNIQEENPDVIDISAVTGCEVDVRERSQELKQTVDGKQQSYNPPRYKYFYDFEMIVLVKHPYFDDMRFRINDCSVEINPHGPMGIFTSRSVNPRSDRGYMKYDRMGEEIREALLNRTTPAPAAAAPGSWHR